MSAVGAPEAEGELSAKILAEDGQIVGSRTVRAKAPVAATDAPAAVAGLSGAFGRAAAELVLWTNDTAALRL